MDEPLPTARLGTPQWFDALLHYVSLGMEAVGVLAVVLGVVVAAGVAFYRWYRTRDTSEVYRHFRTRVARSILLGLEFLVAADIIGTVAVEPTIQNVLALGLIVLIRTFLSFSLELEIEGRWPWQRSEKPGEAERLAEGTTPGRQ